ncbi:MAG: hypothetical protein WA865_16135, partial [Spirulinaceae cyanobacterium]
LLLGIGNTSVSRSKRWCVHYPIGIYLGWISVATVVNVACALAAQNWQGWRLSAEVWTVSLVFIATAISIAIIRQSSDITYTGVTIWALVAIAVKNGDNLVIKVVALLCAITLLGIVLGRRGMER